MSGEPVYLGLAYTTVENEDEFSDTEWWEAGINANVTNRSIEYSNCSGVFYTEYFDTYEQMAEHIRSMTFDDYYSEWLDHARELSGLDLY